MSAAGSSERYQNEGLAWGLQGGLQGGTLTGRLLWPMRCPLTPETPAVQSVLCVCRLSRGARTGDRGRRRVVGELPVGPRPVGVQSGRGGRRRRGAPRRRPSGRAAL